jgi:Mn-dependent DtxR family transcriptional regulator
MSKDVYVKKRIERLKWIVSQVYFTPGEFADFINTSRANARKYLRRLEKDGYVWQIMDNVFKATDRLYGALMLIAMMTEGGKENERKED